MWIFATFVLFCFGLDAADGAELHDRRRWAEPGHRVGVVGFRQRFKTD